MQRPLVSVVIPVRNYERYIGASIESVLSQGFKDWELIVVDDASTDGTGKIADRYAEGERIRVVHNERNLGQFPTHNHGAKLARGKYLKFFHGDDIMYPHCLEMMVSLMEAFPDAGLGISYNAWPWVAPHLFSPLEAWRAHMAGQTGMFSEGPSGTIFRADAFRRAGGFDGRFRSGDCEMNLRMAMFFGVLLLPGGLWWYRSHDKQVVKQMTPDNTLPETLIWYRELLSHPVNPFSKDQKDQIDQQLVRETCQLVLNRLRRGRIRIAWSIRKECGLSLGEMGAVFSRRRVFPPIPVEVRATWSVFSSKPSAVSSPHASPLVSVLIPSFNAEAHLAEAIESVLAQRFADWELVIVDDASTDRTREIAQSYVDGNRIRYFRNERNLGKWPNHNHCAELARGKYLKFLHADDLLYPHCLQTLFEHTTSDAGGSALVLSAPSPLPAGTRLDYGDALRHECFLSPIMVHSPSAFLMDAGVFRALGGFQPRVAFCERHLQIRAAQQGPVVLANEGLVFFRRLHRWGIQQDEKYPMGLCEGMTWFEQLLLDPTCPLTESEKQYVVFRLRYGVARRAWKLFCTGRIAVLTDSLRAHSIRLKDLLCGLKTIPAEHGAVGANLIQSKTTTVAD